MDADPWAVQPRERARYEDQFRSLNPVNGIITGVQAKGFFCQSQLPVDVLGQIWCLADVDSDGRLDINEFSIACKLITLKLKGFPIPAALPPALRALTTQSPVVPSQITPLSQVPPAKPPPPVIPPQPIIQPQIPPQPMIPPQPIIPAQPLLASQPMMIQPGLIQAQPVQSLVNQQPIMASGFMPQPIMSAQGAMMPQTVLATQAGLIQQPMIATQPIVAASRPSLTGLASIPSGISQPLIGSFTSPPLSAVPTSQGTPVDASRTLDRKASIDSQSAIGSPTEWGVPHQTKLKYTQLFNSHDRTRTGFLSAVQARNIMIQTKLPQKSLAQIWTLADTDNDGKLSCEEFVLALHLCEMAAEGKPLPAALPPELVPPSARRRSSVLSQPEEKVDPASLLISSVSFEDKRKENFDKGQAELERRRATLLEQQRKEKEERERKEREEEERKEQIRREQEARRQAELQEQLRKQMELEQLQEEQRRQAQEQREAARKEAERQRQLEWEKARTLELETQRQREQETVLKLKAKNQSLAIDLTSLTGKVKELSSKITETRAGVAAVKATIDGMRSTRDTHMSEMTANKAKLKEQNQRFVLLMQEKAKLEARNKATAAADAAAAEVTNQACTNKQITIKNLNEKLAQLESEVESKTAAVENNNLILRDLRTALKNVINSCDTVYETYADKRDQVLQLKAANSGWGGGGGGGGMGTSWGAAPVVDSWGAQPQDAWGAAPSDDAWGAADQSWPVTNVTTTTPASTTHHKYRALYEFSSRNPDELSFMPGDTILVPVDQKAEPGWLMGELQGNKGWFPESYVESLEGGGAPVAATAAVAAPEKLPLDGIPEVPEVEVKPVSEVCVAIYPYQACEVGDLSFEQGEVITVIKKEGDWWTGVIGDRSGIFPANYVQPSESQAPAAVTSPTTRVEPAAAVSPAADPGTDSDDVFLQPGESKASSKSPINVPGTMSGRETPAEADRVKPATPDFTQITAAQTKLLGKKGEIATVIAPYQATSSEQLSLARGQLVCIRKKTTTGWWEGELQAKGKKKQVGWFPATYVKVMASRRLSQTTPDFEAELNAQKVIAMFPYKALNEDELTFEKDDVISIVSRDDAAWWKGDLKGVVGLFPSNYVMPVDNQSTVLRCEDRLRQESIIELVESERAYTNDMATVRVVFERPLTKSGLLTREQLGRIFLNWRDILKENKHLLRILDNRKQNGIYHGIGDILVQNIPRMSSYIRFCSCQLSAGALLQELTDNSTAFRELCKQCQRDPRTQGLPLSTFLIKPMQRITKYPLLITKILENTPKDHPDRANLELALKCSERLCSQVNEGVREQENSEKLEWLQSHIILDGTDEPITFNSLTKRVGPRKFIRHSCLSKTRSGRELVAFLLSDCLVLTQPLKPLLNGNVMLDKNSNLVLKLYKKPLLLHDMTIERGTESGERSFVVCSGKEQCGLTAGSAADATSWISALQTAQAKALTATTPVNHVIPENEEGPATGRLLVEVMEASDLQARPVVCELRLGNQKLSTGKTAQPFKFHHSMQFIVRNVNTESIQLALTVLNEFMPDDVLDRREIKLTELRKHSTSSGPILHKISLNNATKAQLHIKFDLVIFND